MNSILISYDVRNSSGYNISDEVEEKVLELNAIIDYEKGIRSAWLIKTDKSTNWIENLKTKQQRKFKY